MSKCVAIHLCHKGNNEGTVTIYSPQGNIKQHDFTLPWVSPDDWKVAFQYLSISERYKTTWNIDPATNRKAIEFGYTNNEKRGSPLSNRVQIIGKKLYDNIFGDKDIHSFFINALNCVTSEETVPIVALHLVNAGRILQACPWEILHDEQDFLFKTRYSLVRYIDVDKVIKPINIIKKLNILLIAPRPQRMPSKYQILPDFESIIIQDYARKNTNVFCHKLLSSSSTLDEMRSTLESEEFHAIHIDVHGDFGWVCLQCGFLNPCDVENCQRECCSSTKQSEIQGYLAFQDTDKLLEWRCGDVIGSNITNKNINLVVLSSCYSGLCSGGSIFNSVAGSLIKKGVPAVVAMQYPVESKTTKTFIDHFYKSLLIDGSVLKAFDEAKKSIIQYGDAWYRPALYLCLDKNNIDGKIFKPSLSFNVGVNVGNILDYEWDIYLGFDHTKSVLEDWIYKSLFPLLEYHLSNELAREVKIFPKENELSLSAGRDQKIRDALLYSRCFITICSPSYINSEQGKYELSVMLKRKNRIKYDGLILPVGAHNPGMIPQIIRKMNPLECYDYVYKNLQDVPLYFKFQQFIEPWYQKVARAIKNAPKWKEDFLSDLSPDPSIFTSLEVSNAGIYQIPQWQ